jgi:hypothetical protein
MKRICDCPSAVFTVLQDQARELEHSLVATTRLTKWLSPTVDILYAFLRPSMRVLAW